MLVHKIFAIWNFSYISLRIYIIFYRNLSVGNTPASQNRWTYVLEFWYRAMRGVPIHIYCIQFCQYTHPMGSGRPPWAAGEYTIAVKAFTWPFQFNRSITKKMFSFLFCLHPTERLSDILLIYFLFTNRLYTNSRATQRTRSRMASPTEKFFGCRKSRFRHFCMLNINWPWPYLELFE